MRIRLFFPSEVAVQFCFCIIGKLVLTFDCLLLGIAQISCLSKTDKVSYCTTCHIFHQHFLKASWQYHVLLPGLTAWPSTQPQKRKISIHACLIVCASIQTWYCHHPWPWKGTSGFSLNFYWKWNLFAALLLYDNPHPKIWHCPTNNHPICHWTKKSWNLLAISSFRARCLVLIERLFVWNCHSSIWW